MLPKAPYRQWTLSLPWRIRWTVATQPKVLSAALSVMQRRIFAWQRRSARRAGIASCLALGRAPARFAHKSPRSAWGRRAAQPLCGSVTFIQRFDGQLRLFPHFHTLVPDGVFVRTDDDTLQFVPLPPPSDAQMAKLVAQIGRRIEACVAEASAETIDDDEADALQLSLVEAAKLPQRARWWTDAEPGTRVAPRCAQLEGYSLHANVAVAKNDRRGLRRLVRYGARPPLAAARVSWSAADQRVVYSLRKPTATGRTELRMTPQQFIGRLAALTPPPWLNAIRFHGLFASRSAHRGAVAQRVAAEQDPGDDPFACRPLGRRHATDADAAHPHEVPVDRVAPPPHVRIAWSELLRRTFDNPLVCPRCRGQLRLVAVIKDPQAIAAILGHPAHRDDDPDSGPDPPQLALELEPHPVAFEPA